MMKRIVRSNFYLCVVQTWFFLVLIWKQPSSRPLSWLIIVQHAGRDRPSEYRVSNPHKYVYNHITALLFISIYSVIINPIIIKNVIQIIHIVDFSFFWKSAKPIFIYENIFELIMMNALARFFFNYCKIFHFDYVFLMLSSNWWSYWLKMCMFRIRQ